MDWIIALGVFIVLMALMPMAVRWTKRSNTHGGSGIDAIGGALTQVFDPAAARSHEAREEQRLVGPTKRDDAGDGDTGTSRNDLRDEPARHDPR